MDVSSSKPESLEVIANMFIRHLQFALLQVDLLLVQHPLRRLLPRLVPLRPPLPPRRLLQSLVADSDFELEQYAPAQSSFLLFLFFLSPSSILFDLLSGS